MSLTPEINDEGRAVARLSGLRAILARWLSVMLSLLVLYTAAFGQYDSLIQRPVFTALVVVLTLLFYPLGVHGKGRALGAAADIVLALFTIAACAYVTVNSDTIMVDLPNARWYDTALTFGLVVAVLETSRRAVGIVFPAIVVCGLVYAFFGQYLSGPLAHRAFDLDFITETLLLGDLGIWGLLTGVAATTIAAFVLFGSVLLFTGAGQTFMDLAVLSGGRSPGGAAKIATIASGLFGTINGSAVANAATVGNFTIPLMQRLKYPSTFAAAVEAVASTGGQIAPPVMGAGAFVMAEILGTSYATIMLAAVLPAFLFYLGVFLTIHVAAVSRNLPVVPASEIPAWRTVLTIARMLPIAAAFGGLLAGVFNGRSVQTSAFWGIVGLLAAYAVIHVRSAGDLKAFGASILEALADAARGLVLIGVLLIGAQILVAMINMTGVGIALSNLIASLAGESVLLLALLVAVICLILGMGIPTTAAYVLVAAVLAPALIKAGSGTLVAHMFVFYFATISVITPPVCVAVFVAAGIAKTPWLPVGIEACKLAAVTYVVPFLFLLYPGMLAAGTPVQIADAAISGVLFVVAFALLFGGARITGLRALDVVATIVMAGLAIAPYRIGLLGSLFVGIGLLWMWRKRRSKTRLGLIV
jgi:TRAP transporter 4TM/12TM fusion protein